MEVSSGRTQQSVIGAYYDVINIIGRRLSLNPKARITLHGSAVSDEDVSLAMERVKRVREYLESRYPLTRGRIAVAHEPTNQRRDEDPRLTDEARHVYISGDWEVLRPVVVVDTIMTATPPTLSFTFEHVRQLPQDVRITAKRGGSSDLLFAYNDIELPREPITWNANQVVRAIHDRSSGLADELEIHAELMYEDSPTADSAILRLPIVRNLTNPQVGIAQDQRREFVYNLILFNRDMSDLRSEHIRVIDSLIAADGSISSRSTIRVVGYADSTGSRARNESLSRERAENVAARLRKRYSGTMPIAGISEVRGVGTYDVLKLPDGQLTPESRFYSRTVFIYVEESQ
jgi:outer membrane protein OmpA-like peptidoglycan-associated protein